MIPKTKVFGIGFHKTGTTSLAAALRILGYRVTGPNGVLDPNIARNVDSMAFDLAERFDAFQDNPWPLLFRKLDARFPASKFILTVRPAERWIRSVVQHFGSATTPMRTWVYGEGYGFPAGNEQHYIARYEAHNAEVIGYFKERPQDLLVLRLTEGQGWEQLCPFLGLPIPARPFPQENTALNRSRLIQSAVRNALVAGARALKGVSPALYEKVRTGARDRLETRGAGNH